MSGSAPLSDRAVRRHDEADSWRRNAGRNVTILNRAYFVQVDDRALLLGEERPCAPRDAHRRRQTQPGLRGTTDVPDTDDADAVRMNVAGGESLVRGERISGETQSWFPRATCARASAATS